MMPAFLPEQYYHLALLLLAAVIMIRRRQDAREGTDATETPDVETDGAAEGEGRVHRDR